MIPHALAAHINRLDGTLENIQEFALYSPDIHTLCEFSRSVATDSARDLNLLRDIETTLDSLRFLQSHIEGYERFASQMMERIQGIERPAKEIDPDNKLLPALEQAREAVHALHDGLIAGRGSARRDTRLTDDDGIEDAYTDTIAVTGDLHNAINALRWAIGEHDADLSPVSKVYDASSLDELFKDLDS